MPERPGQEESTTSEELRVHPVTLRFEADLRPTALSVQLPTPQPQRGDASSSGSPVHVPPLMRRVQPSPPNSPVQKGGDKRLGHVFCFGFVQQ